MANNRIYISGPISGRTREEYMRHFREAEEYLRDEGLKPVNPTRFFLCRLYGLLEKIVGGQTAYRTVLVYDLWRMLRCQGVYMLEGWQMSRGACVEHDVAEHFNIEINEENDEHKKSI